MTALVSESVDVPLPIEVVERGLVGCPDMCVWAEAAYRRGEGMAVGPGVAGLAATIDLDVGEPVYGTEKVTIPFAWRAAGAEWLFPHMEAELVLTPIAPSLTHLVLRGRYSPPMHSVGKLLDRLAMHRIAEATVRNFLERMMDALTEEAQAGGSAPFVRFAR